MKGCVGLAEDEQIIAEMSLDVRQNHSARLMPAIDYLIKQSGLVIQDIDLFVAGLGPGSFTGLRIGLSTLQGLSSALDKRLMGIPSLDVYAWNAAGCLLPVCPMLDARMGQVYTAMYEWRENRFSTLR